MFDRNPKTKGVLSAALIPQERFGPRVGITGDFNHVMGHRETGLQRLPACVLESGGGREAKNLTRHSREMIDRIIFIDNAGVGHGGEG